MFRDVYRCVYRSQRSGSRGIQICIQISNIHSTGSTDGIPYVNVVFNRYQTQWWEIYICVYRSQRSGSRRCIRIYRSQRSTPHRSTMYTDMYTDLKNKKYHIMHAVNLAYMHRKTLILFIPPIARGEWVGQ